MTKITIEFCVKVNELLARDLKVFLSGSCDELGSWNPDNAKRMNLQECSKINKYAIWKLQVSMPFRNINYRYFIASSDENYESPGERTVIISSWESNVLPRKRDIYNELLNQSIDVDEPPIDVYGYIDDHYRVLQGWLTDHSSIGIRLYRNPIRFYKPRNKNKKIFIRCKYYQINRSNGCDDDDDDTDTDDTATEDGSVHSLMMMSSTGNSITYSSSPEEPSRHTPHRYGANRKLAKYSILEEGHAWPPKMSPENGVQFNQDMFLTFHFTASDIEDIAVELEVLQLASDISRSITPCQSINKIDELEDSVAPQNQTDNINNSQTNLNKTKHNHLTIINPPNSLPSITNSSQTQDDLVVIGTARMALLPRDREIRTLALYNIYNRPIGEIKIDFVAVHPLLGQRFSMENTFQKHWKHRKTLNVGHKGSGTSYGFKTQVSGVRENTLYSLKNAHAHGADYVEFDVQLSKDRVPVVFHDFQVATVLRKKQRNELKFLEVAVKDLTVSDLHSLKVDHTSVIGDTEDHQYYESQEGEDIDPMDLQPFPTLETCLENVDVNVGFNIELKYPQELQDGSNEQVNYFTRNEFVDEILKIVLQFTTLKRRIIFSSFDPDICLMFNLKQNLYPILFLTQGATPNYPWYKDLRTQSLELSMYFAMNSNLLGLCVLEQSLINNPMLVRRILEHKLILFLWGDGIANKDIQKKWRDVGVHGIIFDRIHEFQDHGSKNVFEIDITDGSFMKN